MRAPAEPFSILVPVYNEAPLLRESLARMLRAFDAVGGDYEILVCENGSTDDTRDLVRELERIHTPVRADFLPTANYGLALKHGLASCRHDLIVILNIDFWSVDFVRRALASLADGTDLVVGSKVMAGSRDERPWLRRAITQSFNGLLRALFGFRGTDTHGMKALRKSRLQPIAQACVTDRSLFDTELVLRAQRAELRLIEIPVDVREIRQPGWVSVAARIPEAAWNLVRLAIELWRP
jgi:glycosyltransferase involved in cell wall biosynthesis